MKITDTRETSTFSNVNGVDYRVSITLDFDPDGQVLWNLAVKTPDQHKLGSSGVADSSEEARRQARKSVGLSSVELLQQLYEDPEA